MLRSTHAVPPSPLPPSAQIFGLGMAAYVPHMLHVMVKQGIPDLLVDGPRTSADRLRRPACTSARCIESCVRLRAWASSQRSPAGSSR